MSSETVCFRKNLPIGIKQTVPLVCRKVSISLGRRRGGRGFSVASVLHTVESWGRSSGTWDRERGGDGARMTDTGVVQECKLNVSQHCLVFSVYMCVRGCGCLSFCFPVSTGELKSGNTDL